VTSEELDARLRDVDAGLREVRALLERSERESRERWARIEARREQWERELNTRRKTK